MKRKPAKRKKSLIKKPRWQNRRQILFTLCGMIRTLVLMGQSEHLHADEAEKLSEAFNIFMHVKVELKENLCS